MAHDSSDGGFRPPPPPTTDGGTEPEADAAMLATACHSQLPGVRLCLDFEGSLSDDSSGYPHSIAMQNVSPTTRSGQGAALLDGSSAISIGDSPDLDMPGPLSMEMWIDPSDVNGQDVYVVSSDSQYGLWVSNGQLMCGITAPGGSSATVSSVNSVPTNTWTHVACVFDGMRLKLYIGGNGEGCTQQAMTIDTQQRRGVQLGLSLYGGLDDVHLYSSALKDSDVCRLATGGTACKPAGCGFHL